MKMPTPAESRRIRVLTDDLKSATALLKLRNRQHREAIAPLREHIDGVIEQLTRLDPTLTITPTQGSQP